MTNQEIFDKVYTHLITQNAKSTDGEATCAYRGTEGRRCAIGCLIPDHAYKKELEGFAAGSMYVRPTLNDLGIHVDDPTTLSLLSQLQAVHDVRNPGTWKVDLWVTAEKFNLTVPQL